MHLYLPLYLSLDKSTAINPRGIDHDCLHKDLNSSLLKYVNT
jgi:hypothetical protein